MLRPFLGNCCNAEQRLDRSRQRARKFGVVRMIARRPSSTACVLPLAVACISLIIGYTRPWKDRQFSVYDNRFKILDYSISRGTSHSCYDGNPILGRMRAKLGLRRQKFQDGGATTIGVHTPDESIAFILRYEGDFPFGELDGLRAVLTNDNNFSRELKSINMRVSWRPDGSQLVTQCKQPFIRCYILHEILASDDSFRIDFRLKSAADPIASWRVGDGTGMANE